MMRTFNHWLPVLIILASVAGCTVSKSMQGFKSIPYAPVNEGYVWHYKTGNEERYQETIQRKAFTFKGTRYYPRIRKHTDGTKDTVFFRNNKGAYYHYNQDAGRETKVIPQRKEKNVSWTSADNAWRYRIIATDTSIAPPGHTYSSLLAIKAVHIAKDRPSHHSAVFYDFYHREKGFVASVSEGDYFIYLSRLEKNSR